MRTRRYLAAPAALLLTLALAACGSSDGSSSDSTTTTRSRSSQPIALDAGVVRQLQVDLDAVGCDAGTDDGIFGPETLAALQAFQRNQDLPNPGVYTEGTRTELRRAVAAGDQVCTPPATTTTTAPAPPANPACTPAALAAALPGTDLAGGTVDSEECSGAYAAAGVTVGTGETGFEVTALFRASGSSWVVVDRTGPCAGGAGNPIPASIFQAACETN
jgi:peptidoglycan hydrolase-like protein with peptidoglycan-binding domain